MQHFTHIRRAWRWLMELFGLRMAGRVTDHMQTLVMAARPVADYWPDHLRKQLIENTKR